MYVEDIFDEVFEFVVDIYFIFLNLFFFLSKKEIVRRKYYNIKYVYSYIKVKNV